MVLRGRVLSEVINNVDVCEMLAPESMRFLLGLHEIIGQSVDEESSTKTQIKQYLQSLGADWLALWREAHAMIGKSEEEGQDTYLKTLVGFRREKLMRLLKESQQEVIAYADNPHRQAEVFDRIRTIKSQLDSIVRG